MMKDDQKHHPSIRRFAELNITNNDFLAMFFLQLNALFTGKDDKFEGYIYED